MMKFRQFSPFVIGEHFPGVHASQVASCDICCHFPLSQGANKFENFNCIFKGSPLKTWLHILFKKRKKFVAELQWEAFFKKENYLDGSYSICYGTLIDIIENNQQKIYGLEIFFVTFKF